MDPEADADTAAAMAAAMGFSSFGAQDRPQKKRRYNPAVDAVAHSSPSASTGSNSTPLGKPSASSGSASRGQPNADEINLEDEDEEQDGAAPQESLPVQESKPAVPSHHGLPARPAPGTAFVGSPAQFQGRHGGVSRAPDSKAWYEGYYDSTSNENPWERLEKRMGLAALGSWVSRQSNPVPTV